MQDGGGLLPRDGLVAKEKEGESILHAALSHQPEEANSEPFCIILTIGEQGPYCATSKNHRFSLTTVSSIATGEVQSISFLTKLITH
jgi:hypothetical protein